MKILVCRCGADILIDNGDFELLDSFPRYCQPTGKAVYVKINDELLNMARLLINVPFGFEPDHKDLNPHNNQKFNLRVATTAQNQMNRKVLSSNTLGYKGVSWNCGNERWAATIWANKVRYNLGYFDNIHEAAIAYNIAARLYHGEFARLNTIEVLA